MPLSKDISGAFIGILSDNSIDRDGEFMSKSLLQSWVNNKTALPMLANHENKIEKLIGGWHEKQLISKGDSHAMVAKPFFLESNPLAVQTKAMVEECLAKGLGVGISIGAIPKGKMVEKEVDGKTYKGYTDAEILEATIVPIQSNRNATFLAMAKSFDINTEEENKMEKVEKEIQGLPEELIAPVEELKVETVIAEDAPVVEEVAEVVEVAEPKAEVIVAEDNADKLRIIELEKKLKQLEEKSVLKATVEGPTEVKTDVEPTFKNLLRQRYGGQ